jgi:hypothetical protein
MKGVHIMNKEDLAGFGGSVDAEDPQPPDVDQEDAHKKQPDQKNVISNWEHRMKGHRMWCGFHSANVSAFQQP